jgi:hypothetical protein
LSGIPDLKMAEESEVIPVKTMLIAFFDAEGLMYHELLPQRQIMNKIVCITVLQRLRDCISSETALQMVFRNLDTALQQCAMPRCPECQRIIFPNTASPWFPTCLIRQIWPSATSYSSPG